MSGAAVKTTREAVIEVRGLRNQFGTQVVHDNLELSVQRGEIIGVVGGSGCGKSVLMRSIIGLNRPVAGEVRLFGERVEGLSGSARERIDRRCGVLFQNGALFSSLTVTENVEVPMRELGTFPAALMQRLSALKLVLVGLSPSAGLKFPSELSGGMIKRAALARALALDPELLFLDEPTAGLDPIGAAAFDQLIVALRDSLGLTVFLITHDLDTLHAVCDRVAVLAQQKVLAIGPLSEVARHPDPWVQEYFCGPRGRAASATASHHSPRG